MTNPIIDKNPLIQDGIIDTLDVVSTCIEFIGDARFDCADDDDYVIRNGRVWLLNCCSHALRWHVNDEMAKHEQRRAKP